GDNPIKVLLNGQPGTGKSSLALYLADKLGCNQWTMTKLNGTQVKIEAIEEMARSLHYRDLFAGHRLIWIEEADKIPHVAQVRFLTLLDELPAKCAVICTSNASLDEFEKRFQSRFMAMQVDGPNGDEMLAFLKSFFRPDQLTKHTLTKLTETAVFACGNVRQALLDVQVHLL